jgi:hypothetical protein
VGICFGVLFTSTVKRLDGITEKNTKNLNTDYTFRMRVRQVIVYSLMMKAVGTSETSVYFHETIWSNIAEDIFIPIAV